MSLRIAALTTPSHRICPFCRSADVHRSRKRGFVDRILGFTGIRPYRCHFCERRHYGYACFPAPRTNERFLPHPFLPPKRFAGPYQPSLFQAQHLGSAWDRKFG